LIAAFGWAASNVSGGARVMAVAVGDLERRSGIDGRDTMAPMGPSRMVLSKPVIAAIEGHAVAGGTELALWADMRVVADEAVLGIFCRRLGVPLIDGGTIRLARLIGHSRAMDLILTGRPVKADEALLMGLANRACPRGRCGLRP
jgi:enoyl-CoA hydratase